MFEARALRVGLVLTSGAILLLLALRKRKQRARWPPRQRVLSPCKCSLEEFKDSLVRSVTLDRLLAIDVQTGDLHIGLDSSSLDSHAHTATTIEAVTESQASAPGMCTARR